MSKDSTNLYIRGLYQELFNKLNVFQSPAFLLASRYLKYSINEQVQEIITMDGYDPSQWTAELILYSAHTTPTNEKLAIIIIFLKYLDPKYYEVFPIEWWVHVYQSNPQQITTVLEENPLLEFVESLIVLSNFQE